MGFTPNYHVGPLNGPHEPRSNASQVLSDKQVPHVIWFEDVLFQHGVPTVVFDLYILAKDIDFASNTLAMAGWTSGMQGPHRIGNAEVDLDVFPQQRLISPDSKTRTVLLPAPDWKFPLISTHLYNIQRWRTIRHKMCHSHRSQACWMH